MTLNYLVGMQARPTLWEPEIPPGALDLVIYKKKQEEEQRKRDEQFGQIPLEQYAPQPTPYRRPEPPKRDEERGVWIIPMS